LNPIKLSQHPFWMIGFNDVHTLDAANEERNTMEQMMISKILIWVPYDLQMKRSLK